MFETLTSLFNDSVGRIACIARIRNRLNDSRTIIYNSLQFFNIIQYGLASGLAIRIGQCKSGKGVGACRSSKIVCPALFPAHSQPLAVLAKALHWLYPH